VESCVAMPPLIDNVRTAMSGRRGARPTCLVCGRSIKPRDERLRLRGGTTVHRACATYEMRRRRIGPSRLGYPPAP
jgi:adenine-specific DNA methylase